MFEDLLIELGINTLPEGWRFEILDDVCNGVFDCPHSTPKLSDNGPYAVRTQDIRNGFFDTTKAVKVSHKTYADRIKRAEPLFGDLLFSREGTYFGDAAEVPENTQVCLGQRMVLIKPKQEILDSTYLRAYINSSAFQRYLLRFRDGSVAERLNLSVIRKLPVLLPDIEYQKLIKNNIVPFEKKTSLNRQTNQTLEEIAQAIFKSWFVDFEPTKAKIAAREALLADYAKEQLSANAAQKAKAPSAENIAQAEIQAALESIAGVNKIVPTEQLQALVDLFPNQLVDSELGEIPMGWEVTPFSKLTKLTKGKNITKKTVVHGSVPVVAGGLKPSCYHNTANVKGPVITVSASGANAGYVNIYYTDVWASDCSFICSKATKYLYTNYVLLKLKQKLITSMQTGAAQPHIYPKDFDRLNVVNPGNNLFEIIEDIFSGLFNKIKYNELENTSLGEIRDILLPKLLSGDLPLECDN
ncbi:restriction endonuclease subunit S [Colwellia sp. D2M02]|uniref:restriction endonuclease subunit S n=1 Tax=Colwellia sp. D2M02 TaxID=2841562 RepID=UPI001C0A0F56|nr:restriction endonuclease subunit S [Colwellia sp. D2M02]MBU2894944.1 restriction endonuclease subunit S [Colwellia sp. D2M02]